VNSSRSITHPAALEPAETRFALRVAACLTQSTENLGADITERLRFARETALQRARAVRAAAVSPASEEVASDGTLRIIGWPAGRWLKLASLLPLVALVAGLALIQDAQLQSQISMAAEIDTDLLADDLPPVAYGDAGFVEYLKLPKD
jgi:Protein of unknown function (DUF3619)